MPIPLNTLFPNDAEYGGESKPKWNYQVFLRAYGGPVSPFGKVVQRLRSGFSSLVYLPGNCMEAAEEYVTRQPDFNTWKDYGKHPGGKKTVDDIWCETGSMVDSLKQWLNQETSRPHVIFHNLNLLSDGRGQIYGSIAAQTAYLSLLETSRKGILLGFSDRDAGRLPDLLETVFDDKIWLSEIDFEHFGALIPRELGETLSKTKSDISDITAWLIASRLRWTDPIRALKIMREVAKHHSSLDNILGAIEEGTRNAAFVQFSGALTCQPAADSSKPTGFPDEVIEEIRKTIVEPFQYWKEYRGGLTGLSGILRILGALPKGLVLHGPPGTGKTELARWIASAIKLPVRLVRGADIKASLYGDAEKKVHQLFAETRKAAPCVLVLDDAEDLLPVRRTHTDGSATGADRGIVDAFIQELDGFHSPLQGVLVIVTTNQFNAIDPAALSRLLPHIHIPFPLNEEQVLAIVQAIAKTLHYELQTAIEQKLVQRFMLPVTAGVGAPGNDPASIRQATSNRFSPRDIRTAMVSLRDYLVTVASYRFTNDELYIPDENDLERMTRYLERNPIN